LRRSPLLVAVAVALICSAAASAGFQPVRRNFGELQIPRVRAGKVTIPKAHGKGRVTVIVTLDQPPLAAAHYARTMLGGLATRQLNVHSSSSRAYLASLDRLQAAAVVRLHRAIPQATVGRRLKIILDGLTVTLPLRQLPKLYKLGLAKRVYPSARFAMNLDDSPSLIGATAFINRTGANGEGMKIAVVDDGIDQTSTFFDAKSYSYPTGFPLGQKVSPRRR
jgi:hypothetical protein